MKNKNLKMMLCEGRHEIPQATDGYLVSAKAASRLMTRPDRLEVSVFASLWGACYANGWTHPVWEPQEGYGLGIDRDVHLDLYVTGLSVALVATLNVCRCEGVSVTCWHYDRDSGDYFPQTVYTKGK